MNNCKRLTMTMLFTCVIFQVFAYEQTTVGNIVWCYTINETTHEASLGYSAYREYAGGTHGYDYYPAIATSTQGDLKIPSQLNGYTVKTIGQDSFRNCEKITSVTIPDSVNGIVRSYVFNGCRALTNVVFGANVNGEIGYFAFGNCVSLKHITIPYGITKIQTVAFSGCSGLRDVLLPDSLSYIGKNAFSGCTNLHAITIPRSVTQIDTSAFYCTGLKSVTLCCDVPEGLTSSYILEAATAIRYRKKFATNYETIVPTRLFAGYVMLEEEEWLNIPDQLFSHYANAKWSGDYDVSHDGEGAMRSGAVGNNGESWIETNVNGPVRVSFWWKASSEEYNGEVFDYAYLSLDGEPQGTLTEYQLQGIAIGGKTGWTNVVYDITEPGEHTVRWTYKKDEVDESDVGEDCVWLDEVLLDPLATLTFSINGGEGLAPAPINAFMRSEIVLPTTAGFDKAKYSFVGWSDGSDTYGAGAKYVVTATNVAFTAVWRANTLAAPSIVSEDVADGGILDAKSATITMTAEAGARIHYTLDGSTPTSASVLYTGAFAVDGLSVNVRAIAIRNNYFDSSVAEFSFARKPSCAAECLNAEWRNVSTDAASPWTEILGDEAHDGVAALKSGAIGDGESSSVEMTVVGAGQIGFWWKTSSEISRNRKYDYVSFLVDGEELSWLGGEKDWTNEVFSVSGDGVHTLRWVYQKNDNGQTQGQDCAWLDEVTWTSSDPLPEITSDAETKAVLAQAGDEVRLKENLSTMVAYNAFRSWVYNNSLSHALVKCSPNAWLSYVLDAPGLMAKASALASEDIVIESIEPSSSEAGAFELVVNIASAEIGEGARLAEALGVEGAAELKESAFSTEGISATLSRTDDGKAKAIVTPDGTPPSFFIRVKVK